MESTQWKLGNTIRTARMERGYTQEKLAEILDITPGHLKHLERGSRFPSVPLLLKMMELLDFSIDTLVFPARTESAVLHTDGLTRQETEALARLVDAMKAKE